MKGIRRSAGFFVGILACVAVGVGISTAYSGSKAASGSGQETDRASLTARKAERAGVMTYTVVAAGSTASDNIFTIPEDISIDVETVTMENGAFGSGTFDQVGVSVRRSSSAGTDFQYFISTAFEMQSHNFSPPLRLQTGDQVAFYDPENGNIAGFFQITFHGRVVPQATGFQAH